MVSFPVTTYTRQLWSTKDEEDDNTEEDWGQFAVRHRRRRKLLNLRIVLWKKTDSPCPRLSEITIRYISGGGSGRRGLGGWSQDRGTGKDLKQFNPISVDFWQMWMKKGSGKEWQDVALELLKVSEQTIGKQGSQRWAPSASHGSFNLIRLLFFITIIIYFSSFCFLLRKVFFSYHLTSRRIQEALLAWSPIRGHVSIYLSQVQYK